MSVFLIVVFTYYVHVDNVFESMWAYHYDSAYKNQWWRFLSYMVLHAGAGHIAANLFLQLIVGIPLEMIHGFWRPGLLYFLGVLAGSCCVSMFDEKTNTVGASGGVYTLVGAHVADIVNYWDIMPYAWPRFILFGGIFVIDVSISAYRRYGQGDLSVSYSSHMGGALCGLTLGAYVLDELPHHENKIWKMVKNYGGLAATCCCFLAALIFNLVSPQQT
ncbi:hypothetical protein AAMO2058_000898000 [Amorphochlora amoebiformis]